MSSENSNDNEQLNRTAVQSSEETIAPSDEAIAASNETIVVEAPFDSDAIVAPEQRNSRIIRAKDSSSYSKIADICLYFENNWTPERTFSIKDALRYLPPELRREAFKELACIDISLGATNNASIALPKYKADFPSWTKEVDEAYKVAMTDSSVRRQARIGRKLGNLRLEGIIGKGGMGVVYKAFNEDLQRYDAVKYIAPIRGDEKKKLDFIRVELVTNGQVKDPRFARAYGSGNDGDFHYLVMEYVDGVDLVRYLRNDKGTRPKAGPISLEEAARYVCEIAKGLCSIHRKGIIHRDIKPENIMLDEEGQIRILDLGLAKWHEGDSDDSNRLGNSPTSDSNGAVVGTPAYMSPEGYSHPELVDEQSDIYSLGGVFFFLVTGKLPLARYNPRGTEPPRPLSEFVSTPSSGKIKRTLGVDRAPLTPVVEDSARESVNSKLLKVMDKMLAPSRDKRYKKAQEVVDDLERVLGEAKASETEAKTRKRMRALNAAVATLAVAFGVTLGIVSYSARKSPAPAPQTTDVVETQAPVSHEVASSSSGNASQARRPDDPDGVLRIASAESVFRVKPYKSGLEIVGFRSRIYGDELVIPSYIDDKPVLRVGDYSFTHSSIRRLVIHEGAREIGSDAFLGCSDLNEIKLPKSLQVVEDYAFQDAGGPETLEIPDSLLSVGTAAFSALESLTAFSISPDQEYFRVVDGVLFSKNGESLVAYPAAKEDESYTVPDGTKIIEAGAFLGAQFLKSATINNDCEEIGPGAFRNCANLHDFVVENNPNFIAVDGALYSEGGKTLFTYAGGRDDEEVVVREGTDHICVAAFINAKMKSIRFPSTLRSICLESFAGCRNLTSVNVPEGVDSIKEGAFSNCSALTNVSLPSTLTNLGDEAFLNDKSLISIAIPSGIQRVKPKTFSGCESLKAVEIGEGVATVDDGAFSDCSNLETLVLPESLVKIGIGAFRHCGELKKINLPNKLEIIGEAAFCEASSSGAIALPDALQYVGSEAFASVRGLMEFTASPKLKNYRVVDGVLFTGDGATLLAYPMNKPGSSYVAPEGTKSIAERAFSQTPFLESISINDECEEIDPRAFISCRNLQKFIVKDNPRFAVVDGALYADAGKTFFIYPSGRNDETVFIPEGVERVAFRAFDNANLKYVKFPSTLVEIEEHAFYKCKNLVEATFPKGTQTIGDYAFGYCAALVDVSLPRSLRYLGEGAFAADASLKSIVIPDETIQEIPPFAFAGCDSLTSVKLGAGIQKINEGAFFDCHAVESLELPETLTSVDLYAFGDSYEAEIVEENGKRVLRKGEK